LDDLAEVVASSGLTGTGLRSGRLTKPHPQPTPKSAGSKTLIVGGALVIGAALIALLVWWVISGGSFGSKTTSNDSSGVNSSGNSDNSSSSDSTAIVRLPKTPNIMGVSLSGPGVIYLLDRGDGTRDTFDAIKGAAFKSIATLGPGIKFQVIFWETDEIKEYPQDAMRFATDDSVATCVRALGDVYAFKASRIEKSLEEAVSRNPDEIAIVTGKSGLDEAFVQSVLERVKGKIKVHTFCMGKGGSPAALKKVAEKTGGQFKEIDGAMLRTLVE
jgi:hypothetical protein